jgi:O-acetyl-ADP-ribose deacetylase (regulator of RNase III)
MEALLTAEAGAARLELVVADITSLEVDAVVNAANRALLGGGGVDGAIHRAAGPGLREECRALGGCRTGEARITRGHGLPAKWVIHTVGPVWSGGKRGERELLAACYRSSLALAVQHTIATIAFPAISTGAYGFPIEEACHIALVEVERALATLPAIREVSFVCYDGPTLDCYAMEWAGSRGTG